MQVLEQTTSHGVACTSLRFSPEEQYELNGTKVTGLTVIHEAPVRFYLAGPEAVQGSFSIDQIRQTVHPALRGGVQQVLDRAVQQAALTPAPRAGHKGLGQRLGKGRWSR